MPKPTTGSPWLAVGARAQQSAADRLTAARLRANALARGKRAARFGILGSGGLAVLKLVAGVAGNSNALIADAVESSADVVSSAIVLGGLQVAGRDPDEQYPFGYGKAETLAGALVALMLLGAGVAIAIVAVRAIGAPHVPPSWWTLAVLVVVMVVKTILSRRVAAVGRETGSTAVQTDAWHHLSDALTSAAAFVGILIAVVGGPRWQAADAWAALVASVVICLNGLLLLRPAVDDLMDRSADSEGVESIRSVAASVPGVLAIEKLAVRRMGMGYRAIVHVQANPELSLRDAHDLGAAVTTTIHERLPRVQSVVVHMEPYEG